MNQLWFLIRETKVNQGSHSFKYNSRQALKKRCVGTLRIKIAEKKAETAYCKLEKQKFFSCSLIQRQISLRKVPLESLYSRPPADRALTWALMGGRNSLICWRNPFMCGRNSLLTLLSYENVPNSVEIIVFFGKIGDLLGPVREKRGTEGIPIWRRGREKLAGTG
ncbi:hypothetical protein J6590_037928 [Homalodisca vitripennis]|nr:hypothetical protein J6590_037928 [Homalodisca vitripennis]